MVLSNGHTLGYSTCGSPESPTIFFMHGYPASRLEGFFTLDVAEKVGARIVCPDRPGIGLSTLNPRSRLLDYPNYISELASHLGLQNYRIIGGSGGAPYALACAKMLPRDQLKGVGIVAGVAPMELGLSGVPLKRRLFFNLMSIAPGVLKFFYDRPIVRAIVNGEESVVRKMIQAHNKRLTPRERDIFSRDPQNIEKAMRMVLEHFRQGSAASINEMRFFLQKSWGFRLEDVDFEGVKLWYGTDDINTPAEMGRKMASRLKGAILKEYPGETHFTLIDEYGEEIFKDMLDT
ncbi:hypothetical protein ACLMJK_002304 [Lecanora helva]